MHKIYLQNLKGRDHMVDRGIDRNDYNAPYRNQV